MPQYVLEDVLRECAQSLPGVRVHFETEFASFSQTEAAVASQVRDLRTGRVLNIESCYLIGADGARSAVRDAISATMLGEGASSRNYSIIFRAPDLAARQIHEPAIMYWMVNEDVPSLLGPTSSFTSMTPRTNTCSSQDLRAESHGCMRVQDPAKYAEVLFKNAVRRASP